MKMSKETFNQLCEAIDTNVISKYSLKVIMAHRRDVAYVKDQFVSFCWSVYHASKFGETHRDIYDTLNDSHIETALKRILADFA